MSRESIEEAGFTDIWATDDGDTCKHREKVKWEDTEKKEKSK
jgi:hypothetical protein